MHGQAHAPIFSSILSASGSTSQSGSSSKGALGMLIPAPFSLELSSGLSCASHTNASLRQLQRSKTRTGIGSYLWRSRGT